jgi:DNA polymerase
MDLLTIDFETYYDKKYSLAKITTEEYIRSDKFEIIGFAIKRNDEPTVWYTGTLNELRSAIDRYDWKNSGCLAHNTMFDSFILTEIFGKHAKMWFDTLSMGQALIGSFHSVSLANMSKYYEIGEKGTEVENALGKRLSDFSEEELGRYAKYCVNDVDLTYQLFKKIAVNFPKSELKLIDITLRMFNDPILEIDVDLLEGELESIKDEKLKKLKDANIDEKILASNKQFAEYLESKGIEVPTKISPTTGKETFALAKADEGFKKLLEHGTEEIRLVAEARKNIKSRINETRIERFLKISDRGALPIPLRYYAAHTGRWGGTDKINLQNLPKGAIRKGIIVPSGYTLIDSDSSQIEARVLAWFAGQTDVVEQFRNKEDVYKIMASKIYKKPVEEITPDERFIGKTCILGCGYQMSYKAFQSTIKRANVTMSEDECKDIVQAYRTNANRIADLWRQGDRLLKNLSRDTNKAYSEYGRRGVVKADIDSLILPNNMRIHYKNLHTILEESEWLDDDGNPTVKRQVVYVGRGDKIKYIYGGKLTENVVQALARIIIGEQMLLIAKKYQVVLTVHDAVACIVPIEEKDEAMKYVEECMNYTPDWAEGLPLTCELGNGNSYGGILK